MFEPSRGHEGQPRDSFHPAEADKLREMTVDEMAVDGYYVVAGIAPYGLKEDSQHPDAMGLPSTL